MVDWRKVGWSLVTVGGSGVIRITRCRGYMREGEGGAAVAPWPPPSPSSWPSSSPPPSPRPPATPVGEGVQEVMEVQGEQGEQGEQGGGVGEEEVVGRRSSLCGAAPATPGGEEGGGVNIQADRQRLEWKERLDGQPD